MDDSELQQLNVEIARKVMQCTIVPHPYGNYIAVLERSCAEWTDAQGGGYCEYLQRRGNSFNPPIYSIARFSEEIAETMKVVGKMQEQGWSFACTLYEGKLPYASFCKGTVASSRNAEAETLPLAICRAALKAVESLN